MLEFLWSGASKTGRHVPPFAADCSEESVVAADEDTREEATEGPAIASDVPSAHSRVTKAMASGRQEGIAPPEGALPNPLAPPGGSPEFSDSPQNVQDEVVDAQDASAANEVAPSAGAIPSDLLAIMSSGATFAGGSDCPRPPSGLRRGRRLVKPAAKPESLNAEQRLLLLDTWLRSGLPASDFAALVGVSRHTLYSWKKKFAAEGPGGLLDQPRGARTGSRLPDLTPRTILMLKQANPEWGRERTSALFAL